RTYPAKKKRSARNGATAFQRIHAITDPAFGTLIKLSDGPRAFTLSMHQGTNVHFDGARVFRPTLFGPEMPGVMGDWQHRQIRVDGQRGAATGKPAHLAHRYTGALG